MMKLRHDLKRSVDFLLQECNNALQRKCTFDFEKRVLAVREVLRGRKTSDVANSFNVSATAVNNWVKKLDRHGIDALRTQPRSGRPPKLSEQQMEQIDQILQKPANEANKNYDVWTGSTLAELLLSDDYKVTMSDRNCRRIFHKLGYTQQRPQMFPSKGHEDSEAREEFKKTRAEIDADPDLIPVYQDEVHFQQQTSVCPGWYKKGSQPRVPSYPGRASLACSGFVIPSTGELFIDHPERFTGETTIESVRNFVEAFPPEPGKKYVIYMDNAPWHKKLYRLVVKEALEEYADIREKVVFVMLPPYSPDLNPIEQVWRLVRRSRTHNRFFRSIADLKKSLGVLFDRWSVPNEQLKELCSFGKSERAKRRHARRAQLKAA